MKKKGHKQKYETCTYAIEILDWEPSYFRSVNINKHLIEGPFWENMDIKIEGKLIHPKKLAEKNIKVNMIGSRQLVRILEEPKKYLQLLSISVFTALDRFFGGGFLVAGFARTA